jgi:hypothetical protein
MPRSRPRAPRTARSLYARTRSSHRVVAGVSAKTASAILRWEVTHPWLEPGSVANALRGWSAFVHGPIRDITDASYGHGEPRPCDHCQPGPDHRDTLQLVLNALPRSAARELHRQVAPLDEHYLRRTVPDSFASAHLPWWQRGC